MTVPVGIFDNLFTSSRTFGSRSFPTATSFNSCSSAPSAENGTSLAIGRLRSRITISSPPLAKVRYLLSWSFSSATFTLRIKGALPSHGYYSHECTLELAFSSPEQFQVLCMNRLRHDKLR